MTIDPDVLKLATPFLSSIVTGVVKGALKKYGHKLPSWLTPILAAIAGAITVTVGGDGTIAADATIGFALGGGAPMVRETYRKIRPEKTADLGNA